MTARWQFSSSGWRSPSNPWFRIGSFEITTTILVVLVGVVTMFIWAANPSTFEPFYFATPLVKGGEYWRLVSWPLINEPSIWSVITIAMFYFFGREVEALLGRNRFLGFLAAIVVIPSVITLLLSYLGDGTFEAGAAGLRLVEIGVFTAYVGERPNARFFFGIPGWALLAAIVGIDALQLIGWRAWLVLILELSIIACSLLIMRGWGFADEVTVVPRLAIPFGPNRNHRRGSAGRRTGSATRGVVAGPWQGSTAEIEASDQRVLDELLDKLAANGLGGLSAAESKKLDELSKKLRRRR